MFKLYIIFSFQDGIKFYNLKTFQVVKWIVNTPTDTNIIYFQYRFTIKVIDLRSNGIILLFFLWSNILDNHKIIN